jgi:glycosyltransferase involved in cell wall biosynthesis
MRILFVSLPDLKKIYPQRPHQIIKRVSKKHDVSVLSVNAWWLESVNDPYLDDCLKDAEIIYMSNRNFNTVFQEISNILPNKKIDLDSFDMLISLNDIITPYILSRKIKIPMVFDICDDIPKYIRTSSQIPYLLRPVSEYISIMMMNKNIKMSDKIIYTNEYLRKKYNISKNKSLCLPNGVDTQLFCKNHILNGIKKQCSIEDDDFVIGFVGYLGKWVDIDSILLASKLLKDDNLKMKTLIIGSGDMLNTAKILAKKLGICEKVIFTGNIPYLSVPKYINCMDVCLLPFIKKDVAEYAIPLKLFEYMACEKIVISTPLLGIKDVVGDKIMYASGHHELAQKIKEIYFNDKNHEIGKHGRYFVEQNYSWDIIYKKFETLIESIEK